MNEGTDGSDRPTILAVEDDPDTAALYEGWLSGRWPTRIASDVDGALAALDESVAVVLLDRGLEHGSGADVLAAVRERGLDCRVAMVTAVEPTTAVVDLDVDDYIVKPVDGDRVRSLVSELLLRSSYDERVREYFSLARKRALLEERRDRAELAGTEEYRRLVDRLEAVRVAADEALAELDDRWSVEGLYRELEPAASAP